MGDYIIKEGDTLGCHDGRRPIVVQEIGESHVTYTLLGESKKRTASRAQFRYALREGGFFVLEHAN